MAHYARESLATTTMEITMINDQEWRRIDMAIELAADRISNEINKMLRKLPNEAAPMTAVELLAARLIRFPAEGAGRDSRRLGLRID